MEAFIWVNGKMDFTMEKEYICIVMEKDIRAV
jgi:hypothetical protein